MLNFSRYFSFVVCFRHKAAIMYGNLPFRCAVTLCRGGSGESSRRSCTFNDCQHLLKPVTPLAQFTVACSWHSTSGAAWSCYAKHMIRTSQLHACFRMSCPVERKPPWQHSNSKCITQSPKADDDWVKWASTEAVALQPRPHSIVRLRRYPRSEGLRLCEPWWLRN